ncbi:MAG: hydroxymyristoyl-ACP dehydratase [Chitinophagaceae bacterium]|nr:MAG: hydroxymyristoyl-ACP dehydratase [Chitinophagaceae bacterium]
MLAESNFYSVAKSEVESTEAGFTKLKAILDVNAEHNIFKGHFPSVPVVPGVCMMQIIKEILEAQLGQETRLKTAANMKFLTVINPLENSSVQLELIYNDALVVNASLFNEGVVYFKFKGQFTH